MINHITKYILLLCFLLSSSIGSADAGQENFIVNTAHKKSKGNTGKIEIPFRLRWGLTGEEILNIYPKLESEMDEPDGEYLRGKIDNLDVELYLRYNPDDNNFFLTNIFIVFKNGKENLKNNANEGDFAVKTLQKFVSKYNYPRNKIIAKYIWLFYWHDKETILKMNLFRDTTGKFQLEDYGYIDIKYFNPKKME